jgi:hypothetical protein
MGLAVTLLSSVVSAVDFKGVGYTVPLYNANDRTGRSVSQVIDVELTKLAMNEKLGVLSKLPFNVDTTFRRLYQRDSIERINETYLKPDAVCRCFKQFGVSAEKILLVYDVTANYHYAGWKKYVLPSEVEYAIDPFGTNIFLDNWHTMTATSPNNFDSLWCKVSLIDCIDPVKSVHRSISTNEDACDDETVWCVIRTIQDIGRSTTVRSGKPDVQFDRYRGERHWGKIIAGPLLCAGGVFLYTLGRSDHFRAKPVMIIGGSTLFIGGTAILTIGIIKQAQCSHRYH